MTMTLTGLRAGPRPAVRLQEQAQFNLKNRSQFLALYMAAVVLQLARQHPDFLLVLTMHLYHRCPFIVPWLPEKQPVR